VLRALRDDDLDDFLAYRNDPDVSRFQYWEGASPAEALAFIRSNAGSSLGRPGQWQQIGIANGADDRLIGDIGLFLRDGGSSAELGFSLAAAHQGRGLAREALTGLIDVLFGQPGLDRLEATTDARNAPAMALLARLGFGVHRTEDAVFKGSPCREHTYTLARGAWRAV
jgi:RimJ/RimL family protein N-acetyltransferase